MRFKKNKRIDPLNLPKHIAVIMDGNGRWAQQRGLSRGMGHAKGVDVLENLLDTAIETEIQVISVYAFSTENWSRSDDEVDGLWKLLDSFFKNRLQAISERGVRVVHSGSYDRLPSFVIDELKNAEKVTAENEIITLNLCINYGGRQEIVHAVNSWLATDPQQKHFSAEDLQKNLYVSDLPDVDLLIRTSGECRVSNFLLWQIAYAEMVFLDVLWPDFTAKNFKAAIIEYQNRNRRFGGV